MNFSAWCLLIILFNGSSDVAGANETAVLDRNIRWTGRIVGGSKARTGQFPYIVSLQKRWAVVQHFCGASIITDRWLLTAAHCLVRDSSYVPKWGIIAVAGENDLNTYHINERQVRNVDNFVVNPRFDRTTLANDIALIYLQAPFRLSPYVSPIPLAKSTPKSGTNCSVAGWGTLEEKNRTVTEDLMFVQLPIINYNYCGRLLWGVIMMHPSIICAGYIEGGKDACQGDSGGPLVCGDLLAGIVSGGRGCARPKLPGFYTNVAYFNNWITQVLKSNGKNHSFNGSSRHPAGDFATGINGSLVYILSCLLVILYFYEIVKI